MRHGHRMVTFSLFNSTSNRAIYTDSFSKDTLRYVRKSRTSQRESLQILKAGKDQHHPRQAFTHLYGLYYNSMFLHPAGSKRCGMQASIRWMHRNSIILLRNRRSANGKGCCNGIPFYFFVSLPNTRLVVSAHHQSPDHLSIRYHR